MKNSGFYPRVWQVMGNPSGAAGRWDNSGGRIKELKLKNDAVTELRISEMQISLTKVTAIDSAGGEYHISNFPGQESLPLKGLGTGHFLRTKNALELPQGTYSKLRFYLGGKGNVFVYNDGRSETANELNSIDFTIANGLTIEKNKMPKVMLWFDFAPFKFSSHFKGFTDLFRNNKNAQRPRLANSF